MSEGLSYKVTKATIWSSVGEFAAKLISPITSMILARLLTPEDFGIVAAINIIISFADMFTDAGFQKYLVQHNFENEQELNIATNVAFGLNIIISVVLWITLIIFRYPFARQVGCEEHANVLIVAGASLVLTSFSSIQMALFRRHLDFKTLFIARIISVLINLIIAIPAAIITRSYWALILGSISVNLSNAIILTVRSTWKPRIYFELDVFERMFSFSAWTLCEQITIWLSTYMCTFIVGKYLNTYYLGLFNNSMTTVNQFTTLLSASFSPVLFSALSRLQDNMADFQGMYLKYKRLIACFTVPLCVGIYAFKEFIVEIMLGSQWQEATVFIGIWALSGSIVLVVQYTSEIYRSLGKPRLSTIVQVCFIVVNVPILIVAAKKGFDEVCFAQASLRFVLVALHGIVLTFVLRFPVLTYIRNVLPCYLASAIMYGVSVIIRPISSAFVWQSFSVIVCGIVYFIPLLMFDNYRREIVEPFINKIQRILLKHIP